MHAYALEIDPAETDRFIAQTDERVKQLYNRLLGPAPDSDQPPISNAEAELVRLEIQELQDRLRFLIGQRYRR
jgi:hypothetical protein